MPQLSAMWKRFSNWISGSPSPAERGPAAGGVASKSEAGARPSAQPDLPDFWRLLSADAVATIVSFATGKELEQLERCRVRRTRTFCRLEAARRDAMLASMAQSARVLPGLSPQAALRKGWRRHRSTCSCAEWWRLDSKDRANCPGLEESVFIWLPKQWSPRRKLESAWWRSKSRNG